jgi:hypothetical protein
MLDVIVFAPGSPTGFLVAPRSELLINRAEPASGANAQLELNRRTRAETGASPGSTISSFPQS